MTSRITVLHFAKFATVGYTRAGWSCLYGARNGDMQFVPTAEFESANAPNSINSIALSFRSVGLHAARILCLKPPEDRQIPLQLPSHPCHLHNVEFSQILPEIEYLALLPVA
jgi:hypothetical protein